MTIKPGDRISVYQYTLANANYIDHDFLANPWIYHPTTTNRPLNKLKCWNDALIVMLRESKWQGFIVVTSEHFQGKMRLEGRPVSLLHCELEEPDYGLPGPEPLVVVPDLPKDISVPPDTDLATWHPNVGDRVHKRNFEGWSGYVLKDYQNGKVAVQWDHEKGDFTMQVAELRPHGVPVQGRKEWKKQWKPRSA